jgi:hypothetical protein
VDVLDFKFVALGCGWLGAEKISLKKRTGHIIACLARHIILILPHFFIDSNYEFFKHIVLNIYASYMKSDYT